MVKAIKRKSRGKDVFWSVSNCDGCSCRWRVLSKEFLRIEITKRKDDPFPEKCRWKLQK